MGRSDEIKGYCIYLRKDKVVIVVQHVKNIEEPINKTIEQQQHSHGTEEDTSLSRDATDKNEIMNEIRSRGCVHHMSRVG